MTAEDAVTRIREGLGLEATGEDPKRPLDIRHLVVTVPLERWVEAVRFARDRLGGRYFCHLTAVDWKAEGFDVVCRVENLETHLGLTLKTRVGREAPCPTLTGLYRGALWMEREQSAEVSPAVHQKSPGSSPPLRLPRACQVLSLTFSLMNCTCPSQNSA